MIETKYFPTQQAALQWIAANEYRYSCTLVFFNNGFGVEYKKLHRIA